MTELAVKLQWENGGVLFCWRCGKKVRFTVEEAKKLMENRPKCCDHDMRMCHTGSRRF